MLFISWRSMISKDKSFYAKAAFADNSYRITMASAGNTRLHDCTTVREEQCDEVPMNEVNRELHDYTIGLLCNGIQYGVNNHC